MVSLSYVKSLWRFHNLQGKMESKTLKSNEICHTGLIELSDIGEKEEVQ